MATLTTSINSVSIPADLDTLHFSASSDFSISIDVEGVVIYSARLYPDASGNVWIYGLAELIYTFLDYKTKTVTFYIDGGSAGSTQCLPCSVSLDMPLDDFIDMHFLTRANGVIETCRGSIEYVSYYDDQYKTMSVVASFADDADKVHDVAVTDIDHSSNDDVLYSGRLDIDAIAAKYPAEQLLQILVTYGKAKQVYRVVPYVSEGEHLYFRNAFGCLEHVFFPYAETKLSAKYSAANINGVAYNYKIDRQKKYEGEAKVLPSMAGVFSDLLMSKSVFRQQDNARMIMSNGSVSYPTVYDQLVTAKATWEEAKSVTKHHVVMPTRTFDHTFDQTFE